MCIDEMEVLAMKGYVDKDMCVGCGMCAGACPDGFHMGDDGLAEGYQELPEGSVDDARQVAEDCPVGAITVK